MMNQKFQCPVCEGTMGHLAEVLAHTGRVPKAGDIALCDKCASALIFFSQDEGIKLRKAEQEDMEKIPVPILYTMMLAQYAIEGFAMRARHRLN